ncbi:hypothetical protein [Paenimyroides tangerinum]|uniref:hypothetical protein n=1 Tax=Paenimyroides tangerinum TaxID=2488728 RepID=UPI0013158949|nr:hypothetical protein [Paenimyroides tangerinum]
MKTYITAFFILVFGFIGNAQEVNNIPLKEIPAKYVQKFKSFHERCLKKLMFLLIMAN